MEYFAVARLFCKQQQKLYIYTPTQVHIHRHVRTRYFNAFYRFLYNISECAKKVKLLKCWLPTHGTFGTVAGVRMLSAPPSRLSAQWL